MGFLHNLYTLRLPLTLVGLVLFAVDVCILYGGVENIAVRIIFGIVALLSVALQLGFSTYIASVGLQLSHRKEDTDDLFSIQGLWPIVDNFFGLATGWGMLAMALWVIDTTASHDKYWSHLLNDSNNWLVAVQFFIGAIDPMTATGAFSFEPVHMLSLLLTQSISAYHFLYALFFFSVVSAAFYEARKERRKRREGAAAADQEMAPLAQNAAPMGRAAGQQPGRYVAIQYDSQGRPIGFAPQ